ncbi:hypothetical protein [Burkholderia sp. D-99]|uniref:hypothetical protein n=1 Tax=Burkholderia sp. D-99 TaxID=2717316 RepID=UPI0014216FEE|nr:hypothetical protein [Burkholderia sp. D-99]
MNSAMYPTGLANLQIVGIPSQWASRVLTGQPAAISATAFTPYSVLHPGLFRVSGYRFITTPGTRGAITPTISWNDGNNSPTVSGTGVAANGGWTQFSSVNYAAAGTNISFGKTFGSVTGRPAYTASFNVEQLP